MNIAPIAMIVATLLSSGAARATGPSRYKCTGDGGNIALLVKPIPPTSIGNTSIELIQSNGVTKYYAESQLPVGDLFKKSTFKLFPFDKNELSIVHQPVFCGRGSCNPGSPARISAELIIDGISTHFSCSENLN